MVRHMHQQTLNVLMSQRKAGPPPGIKGSKKVGSLKVSMIVHLGYTQMESPQSARQYTARPGGACRRHAALVTSLTTPRASTGPRREALVKPWHPKV